MTSLIKREDYDKITKVLEYICHNSLVKIKHSTVYYDAMDYSLPEAVWFDIKVKYYSIDKIAICVNGRLFAFGIVKRPSYNIPYENYLEKDINLKDLIYNYYLYSFNIDKDTYNRILIIHDLLI